MTFEQLIYFTEVYRQKSINAASIFLNISQQSLSTSIKALENEFNTVFFERSHKGVQPTTEGERFYGVAQNIIEQIQTYKSSLATMENIFTCRIGYFSALSADASLLYSYLTEVFPDIFFDFSPFYYESFLNDGIKPDIIFSTLFESDLDSQMKLPDNYVVSRLFNEKIAIKFWIAKNHPLLAQYKTLNSTRLNAAKFVASRRLYLEKFDSKSILNSLTPKEKIYYVQSDAFLTDFLEKGFLASEICFHDKPMIYPFLQENDNLTLIPVSKFQPFYFVIAYNPLYQKIYTEVRNFLQMKYN